MRQYVLWQTNERRNGDPNRSPVVGFIKTGKGSLTVFPSNPGHLSPDPEVSATRSDWPVPGQYEECELYQAIGSTTAHAYPVVFGKSVLLPGSAVPVDITWEKADGEAQVISSIMIDEGTYARVFLPLADDYREKACSAHIRDMIEGWDGNQPVPGDTTSCYLYYVVSGSRLIGYAFPAKSTAVSTTGAKQAETWIAETAIVIVTDGTEFRHCQVVDDGQTRTIRLSR